MPLQSEIKAERAVPFARMLPLVFADSSVAGRAPKPLLRPPCEIRAVHMAGYFRAAPRLAATFGSFWSLQKELAEGREIGEKWMLNKLTADR